VINQADASAIGAAIMGFYALGVIGDLEASAGFGADRGAYEPDEQRHRIYQKSFAVFTTLYERLRI